ncbi:MAG: hypothetical protein J6Y80_06775 [Victivallales bacterium]|nr:hypothetical protein [Victivallales bacterium]
MEIPSIADALVGEKSCEFRYFLIVIPFWRFAIERSEKSLIFDEKMTLKALFHPLYYKNRENHPTGKKQP